MKFNIGDLGVAELLKLHALAMNELKSRGVLRTDNNPTGDLAEYIFCRAFGWTQASNSERSFDATGPDGQKYQIKGRRLPKQNTSRQLSAIRDLEGAHFDVLAGILFDEFYGVIRAALIPRKVVSDMAKYSSHTNSHRFMLSDAVWDAEGVIDISQEVREVEL